MAVWLETCESRTGAYATSADYKACQTVHRRHGTTYFFATRLLPQPIRRRTHALYAFVRTPDEWVDNPASGSNPTVLLRQYREQLLAGVAGARPESSVLRAFCDLARETNLDLREPLRFLDSMEQDLRVSRYQTYEDLQSYMLGSAAAVGVMMCSVLAAERSPEVLDAARALGEAMQLTNFLRDLREDAERDRIYLPLQDLARFEVEEREIFDGLVSDRFRRLMRFEIERARRIYRRAYPGIDLLPQKTRPAVRFAAILYEAILGKIESSGYDVFRGRARTTLLEKALLAAHLPPPGG